MGVNKSILREKHIGRKRKEDDTVGLRRDLYADDDEWSKITSAVGEKIQDAGIMDIQDRSITFNKDEATTTKEEEYKMQNDEVKDRFENTAQYLKFVNAHIAEKHSKLEKLKQESEKFEKELASLRPNRQRNKSDLDMLNYKDIKSDDVRNVLSIIEKERDEAKAKVEHFSSKFKQANEELLKKNTEIKDIESELDSIKNQEATQKNEYQKEGNAMNIIQNELSSLNSKEETAKIYGAINSLVVLLNSKNQETLNELNSMKSEFNKMKKDYEEALLKSNKKK